MTPTEDSASRPENENDPKTREQAAMVEADEGDEDAGEAEPLPWTPERVLEWNAYYDVYVVLTALFLVFVVSATKLNHAAFWSNLKAGQLIAERSAPLTTDPFSYTEPGRPWVDIPWLFQWLHAVIYQFVRDLVPVDETDPTANRETAEQIAVGTLVGLNALVRVLTAWLLLQLRRPGPGLWWAAVCVAIALGGMYGPFGVVLGGVAGPLIVGPSNWGLLFLAAELLCLHRAYHEGKRGALWALVPLFALWANFDESFVIGLLVLAAATVGRLLDGSTAALLLEDPGTTASPTDETVTRRTPIPPLMALLALLACAAACLANPYTYQAYVAAAASLLRIFAPVSDFLTVDELSYFGQGIRQRFPTDWYWVTIYYLLMVAIGLASFLANARRFSWSRFLPFALLSLLWGAFLRYGPEFAVVFAMVLMLNGQEWYLDRFGTEGKLGTAWTVWSTGGRLATLAALFFFVGIAITGWQKYAGEPRFGFGFETNEFPFEAAEWLARRDDIKGNVLNSTLAQGDALIWKAYPNRKTYVDGRPHVHPRSLLEQHHRVRNALRDDEVSVWKPELDRYGITAVMIDSTNAPNTYRRLMQSLNWIPFYDDGRVIMFGRADAPEPDLATFKINRLDPELRAYRTTQPVPPVDRPPTPTTWTDQIFRNRFLTRPQAHTDAAGRWLQGGAIDLEQSSLPDPARCLLAIREARIALSKNPDDWVAYRILNAAYRFLMLQETALLAGIPLTPENQARIARLNPNIAALDSRFRQRVTAIHFAIQTTPPPRNPESRRELQALNLELYQLFLQVGYADLARARLQAVLDLNQPGDLTPEATAQYRQELEQLDESVRRIEDGMLDLQVERAAGPIEKGRFALSQGAPGLAIVEFEEADRANMSPIIVRPQLVDLYCNTGQPDRALELLSVGVSEDPNLGTEPGSSFFRQGQVYLLLGNYLSAASLWGERAIPRLRYERSQRALMAGQILGRGEAVPAVNSVLSIPGLINRQGAWLYELGQCLLESGSPERAAEAFEQALKLVPETNLRPIMAYYLEKMGRAVPPPTGEANAPATPTQSPVDRILNPVAPPPLERGTVPPLPVPPPSPPPASPEPGLAPAPPASSAAPAPGSLQGASGPS
jgi:tetratricopeptide (TPR) repeat protein